MTNAAGREAWIGMRRRVEDDEDDEDDDERLGGLED